MSKRGYYEIAKSALIELADAGNVRAIATLISENVNKEKYLKMLTKMIKEDAIDDPEIAVQVLIDDNDRVDVAHKLLKLTEKKKKKTVSLSHSEIKNLT